MAVGPETPTTRAGRASEAATVCSDRKRRLKVSSARMAALHEGRIGKEGP